MTQTSIDTRLIATDIEEGLRRTKTFLDHVIADDGYAQQVSRYKEIHVPQAGALPEVGIDQEGALTLQATSDTHTSYSLHTYRTNPILVRNYEDYLTSLEKQRSITSEQASQLKNAFCKHSMELLTKQLIGSSERTQRQLVTTGSPRSSSVGSGNRKSFSFSDLLAVRKQLIRDGGDQSDGQYIGVLNAELYADLLQLEEVHQSHHKLSKASSAGAVSEFMGFQLFLREDLPNFVTGSKAAALVSGLSTPNAASPAALFFNRNLVRRAIAPEVAVYLDMSAPRGGVELSSELHAGVSLARTDARGLVVLLEGAV